MTEETKKLPTNMLTAEELLENKGLKYNAWDQYERSAKSLPKTGMKQFEPNDSWLQNMQIEKGIMTRKNLIAIERVDRISQLASAEWLPTQRRARVKKYSGQDWNSFGLEKSGALYLIPEEALFLLEANCLELTWNDVPLSIQQAYELLIDNVECSLEEYRVYSQLVKHGYRIQRFMYNIEKNAKSDESITIKRKVIVEPENGLWMTDSQQQNKDCTNTHNSSARVCQNRTENKDLLNNVYEVVDDLLNGVENMEARCKDAKCEKNMKSEEKLNTNLQNAEINRDKKKKKSEVKIISDETLLGNLKIVIDHISDFTKGSKISPSWRASRIQRNVKLVPRRTDKLATPDTLDSSNKDFEHSPGKHKSSSPPKEDSQIKKSKQEVIELSDDEIHEVPKPMMRMDLLNMIPNIAFQSTVTIKIPRGYIPHSIKPYKTTYYYECANLKSLHEKDNKFRSRKNVECTNNANNNTGGNTDISQFNQSSTSVNSLHVQDPLFTQHEQYTNFGSNYVQNNTFPYTYSQNFHWHLGNTMFQNVHVAINNLSTSIYQNRFMSMQTHDLSVPNISNNMIRNEFVGNQFLQNFHHDMPLRRLHHQKVFENTSIHSNIAENVLLPDSQPRYWNGHRNMNANRKNEVYRPSFKILPGASSWSELKTKWREEKTITIDDEDTRKDTIEDCNEVQVVGQSRSSLVGPKNTNSLEEVFNKLQIIKSAPEKIVRRKKSKYKISYNVYSNTQAYKKANPGLPFYRIVVIRQDDSFIQPIELHRLMQDSGNTPILLACVSMSISYIQPGFIFIPNLT